MVASLTIIKGIEMEMNLDFWQFVLSGLTLLVAVVGGIVGWFWIKPVDRKLQNIDALSHQFNSRIDTLREAVLNSEIKMREQGYNRMIDACLIVRRALQHLIDTFRILTLCKGVKDIGVANDRTVVGISNERIFAEMDGIVNSICNAA